MKIRNIFTIGILISAFGCNTIQSGVERYDDLGAEDEACGQMWANIDAALVRRSDLVPNLVAVVKAGADHERLTLVQVIEQRAAAQKEHHCTSADLDNAEKMKACQDAGNQLGASVRRLAVMQEAYPDLKANGNFKDLMVSIEGTENRLLRAREQYNAAVGKYNSKLRTVKSKIINPITNNEFKPRAYFAADESAKIAPKVDFGISTPATQK